MNKLDLRTIDKFKETIGQTLVFYSYAVQGRELGISLGEIRDQEHINVKNINI